MGYASPALDRRGSFASCLLEAPTHLALVLASAVPVLHFRQAPAPSPCTRLTRLGNIGLYTNRVIVRGRSLRAMEYLLTFAVLALYGWLMWWGHQQDKKQKTGYSLRGELKSFFASLGNVTLKETVVGLWNLCLYFIALLAFFWVAAMIGFTGPVCWRC